MSLHPMFGYGHPSQPPLERVFSELVNVVSQLRSDGRSTRSAGIKPRLSQRLGVDLDVKSYGFGSFRELLNAARDAGVIDLRPAPTGPDVDVVLPGQPSESESEHPVRIQVREDFWSTFMDWTPGIERAYDKEIGRAFRISTAAESWDPSVRHLREQMRANSARFVDIEPIGMAEQVRWANAFVVNLQQGSERDVLANALRAPRPLQEFARKIREQPCLPAWTTFRNEQVVALIADWAKKNNLTIDPVVQSHDAGADTSPVVTDGAPRLTSAPTERRTSSPAATALRHAGIQADTLTALRAHAHELVERMTAEELLALPLTLGILYRR